ncbi:MAG: GNAT family N-acetyltransferase, partial [Chloroflexi bacterium]
MDEELRIRLARPEDRPAMERICAHTWEFGDYIQEVWDEWLAGEDRPLLVAELGASGVVSLNKITHQPAGQIWLEGMRVDPDYRTRGVARRCLDWNLAYARERGARVVRLSTGDYNTPVHTMVAHVGMVRVTTGTLRTAPALPGARRPAILGPVEGDGVGRFWQQSPVLASMAGLYSRDWAWQELSAEQLAAMLRQGEVVAEVAPDGSLAAVATIHHYPGDEEMWVGIADGDPEAVQALALAIRAQAAEAGAQVARAMLPDVPWLREAFQAAGYEPGDWEGEMWVFERRLEAGPSSPGLGQAGE